MSEPLASRKLHPYVPSGVWRWFEMLMESFEVSAEMLQGSFHDGGWGEGVGLEFCRVEPRLLLSVGKEDRHRKVDTYKGSFPPF